MTIYIDIILLENLIMNSIILYATSIILKTKVKTIRVILSSSIGAIYSIILYTTEITIFASIISKIILSIVMIYVAFNPQNVKKMCKQTLVFYLASFVFGGVALYLIYFLKPQDIVIKNGMFAGQYALKAIMLGAIVAFIIIKISIKIIKTKINPVKEPITNTPVIIVESSLLNEILPKEILDNLENILCGNLANIPEKIQLNFISKLRCIPYSSLGKQNGMLVGIKADEIQIENEDEQKKTNNVIIGIYDKSLTKSGEYRALVGMELV